jgi:hypothetical protein
MKYIIELSSQLPPEEAQIMLKKFRMRLGTEGVLMDKHIRAYDGKESFSDIEMSVDNESTMLVLNNTGFGKRRKYGNREIL